MVIIKGWNTNRQLKLLEERATRIRENKSTIQDIEEQLNQTEPTLIPSGSQGVDQPNSPVASNHSGTSRIVSKSHHSSQSQCNNHYSRVREFNLTPTQKHPTMYSILPYLEPSIIKHSSPAKNTRSQRHQAVLNPKTRAPLEYTPPVHQLSANLDRGPPMEGAEPSRRGDVKSRRSTSFSGFLGGYPSISQGPTRRLGESEDEEGEESVE
ncbi:hypothetical protein O181_096290 [Austropuccinia psidii MF-1]|uniref:Uncharacterized protein n=1 Tax=Austropuccinia psidii MF-1 TaxID=1389203 RepID=A0A9Q3J5E0_9BASI|nr:hypothetical protein [Austropuccinia psidii MF-1]